MVEVIVTPKLRFPEFNSNGFTNHKFDNLFKFSTGKNIKQSEASPEFETPCVRYGELYNMYKEVIYEIINRTNLDRNDLLYSDGDEILLPSAGEDPLDIGSASAITIPNIAIGRTINILKPKVDSVYSQIFVSYYINQKLKKKISSLAKGVSISNVYNSDLKKLRATLPSLPEQIKIASFLSAVDNRINLLQQKKAKLEEYKKGVIQKVFSGKIRFKSQNGKDFPNWKSFKLGEIGVFSTSGVNKLSEPDEKEVFLVNYLDVYKHREINTNNISKLQKTTATNNQIQTNDLIQGDILFTPSSETAEDIGHSIVIPENLPNTLYSYHLLRFRPNTKLDIGYSHYFCNIPSVFKQISRYAAGSTRFTISTKNFQKVIVDLPCLEEQNKIAAFLTSIDNKIELVDKQIKGSSQFKKGLLQQMFV